jgi:hypothetical protein
LPALFLRGQVGRDEGRQKMTSVTKKGVFFFEEPRKEVIFVR